MKMNRDIQHILKQRLLNYKKRVVTLGRMGILIVDQHKQTKHMVGAYLAGWGGGHTLPGGGATIPAKQTPDPWIIHDAYICLPALFLGLNSISCKRILTHNRS